MSTLLLAVPGLARAEDGWDFTVQSITNGSTYRTVLFCTKTMDPQTIGIATEADQDEGESSLVTVSPSPAEPNRCSPEFPYPNYVDVPVQVEQYGYGCKVLVSSVTQWWFTNAYGGIEGAVKEVSFAQVHRASPPDPTLRHLHSRYRTEGSFALVPFKQRKRDCYFLFQLKGAAQGIGNTHGRQRLSWNRDGFKLPVGTWKVTATYRLMTNDRYFETAKRTIDRIIRVQAYNRKCMSTAERRRIRIGMSLDEVRRIIGSNGYVEVRGVVTVRSWIGCGWDSDDITVGFVGGRVASIVYG